MTVDGRFIFNVVDGDGNPVLDAIGHPLVYAQNADGTPAVDPAGHIYYYVVKTDGTLDLDGSNHPKIAEFDENFNPKFDEEGNMVVMT